ncbi:MAG: GNAT family N-acetyltransferase [Pseudobdellovibrionaceae bacterium]
MDRPILDSSLQFDGPRSPKESEFKKLLEFLDANLRKGNEWSIAREYPTALSLGNLHNIRMVTDGEEICSHAVLKPLIVKTPLLPIKVGAIGSVVTESSHRNKGLSKKLLEDCLGLAQKQDCDVAILWTNLYDFYRKLGFELAGTEMSFVVENEFRGPLHHLRFIEDNKISPDALLRIYMQHTVTTHRSAEEVRKFMQIPNTRIYSAWDSVGSLAAYAIEGKGADLSGYIHE